MPTKKKPAKKPATAAHVDEWRHPDGSKISVEYRTVKLEPMDLGAANHKLLQERFDELAKKHAFLLRDSAAQGRILAAYREAEAARVEAEGPGTLAIAK